MSSILATDSDTSRFLNVLEKISEQQAAICAQLDELTLLMQMPSESVLRVLQGLLLPINQDIRKMTADIEQQLKDS